MGCMEELSYLWRLPHKGVARRSTVNLFPHWGNGNYGEVCTTKPISAAKLYKPAARPVANFFVSSLSPGAIIARRVRFPAYCFCTMAPTNWIRLRSPRSQRPGSASPPHSIARHPVSRRRSSFFLMLSTGRCLWKTSLSAGWQASR
jgi:hypothetical protein